MRINGQECIYKKKKKMCELSECVFKLQFWIYLLHVLTAVIFFLSE